MGRRRGKAQAKPRPIIARRPVTTSGGSRLRHQKKLSSSSSSSLLDEKKKNTKKKKNSSSYSQTTRNKRLIRLHKNVNFAEAVTTICDARARGIAPTTVDCNKLLSAGVRAGLWEDVLAGLQAMRGRTEPNHSSLAPEGTAAAACANITPSVVSYAVTVRVLGAAGQSVRALEVFSWMAQDGVAPDAVAFNAAVSACGTCADAMRLLGEAQAARLADVVTFNAALATLARGGKVRRAEDLLDAMTARKHAGRAAPAPNAVSFVTLIAALGSAGDADRALALLRRMPAAGLEPSVRAHNAALAALEAADRWRDALVLLGAMARDGVTPDGVSLRTALYACCAKSAGKSEEADADLADAKLNAQERERVQRGVQLLEAIEAGRFTKVPSPDYQMFHVVIQAAGAVGMHDVASAISRRLMASTATELRAHALVELPSPRGRVELSNGPSGAGAEECERLVRRVRKETQFEHVLSALPYAFAQDASKTDDDKCRSLAFHCEKKALALALHAAGTSRVTLPRIEVNIRMCSDCQAFYAHAATLTGRVLECVEQQSKNTRVFHPVNKL
ncbi:hypothetical protein NFJ02_01g40530 [Pycnococcus provasolii]